MLSYIQRFSLLLFYFLSFSANSWAHNIVTAAPLSDNDIRYRYANALLELVLKKTEAEYGTNTIEHYPEAVSRARSLRLATEGKIDVIAEATQQNWESALIPIRIPICKGILGYRLLMAHKNYAETLSNIDSLEDLKKLKTGAGSQWVIRQILEDNGFEVMTSGNYESLFKMLNADRFSTFSRGVNEVFSEFTSQRNMNSNLFIDKHLVLHTHLPTFFFVSPQNKPLALRIQKGLERMIETGEFDEFFYRHHSRILAQAKLKQRKIFTLPNSRLSKETQKIIKQRAYWHRPGDTINNIKK